jgi:hypothetical protein
VIPSTLQTASWRREAEGVFSNWLSYVRERCP